ncbi:MAG: GNAT family N-acetyltransferase [Polyangiaceae bacterium]
MGVSFDTLLPVVRPLNRAADHEIELVARRMRETLVDVLGRERGESMYSLEWLRDRVRWHLDAEACKGDVLLAEHAGNIVGHTIVRVDLDDSARQIGLFSTFWVEPTSRRRGIAEALLRSGEAWLAEQGMTTVCTNTAESNTRLLSLLEKHGYTLAFRAAEVSMVQMTKQLTG